jgi:DNA-binding NarL/FixJ family response regulator
MSNESISPDFRVLIVEDHPIVSESLFRLVNESFDNVICVHAATGARGLSYLNSNHFDIVLLDINLPDISGIQFCLTAIARFPELKLMAVTSLAQRHVVEEAFQAGVKGFVLKTSDIKDITEGIKQVIAGGIYYGKGVKELISRRSGGDTTEIIVTRRENEILKLIADGFTNQEIAEKLFISPSTVDSHRKNLLLKFDAKNSAMLIKAAMSKGII